MSGYVCVCLERRNRKNRHTKFKVQFFFELYKNLFELFQLFQTLSNSTNHFQFRIIKTTSQDSYRLLSMFSFCDFSCRFYFTRSQKKLSILFSENIWQLFHVNKSMHCRCKSHEITLIFNFKEWKEHRMIHKDFFPW